jgi:hypothetical protein
MHARIRTIVTVVKEFTLARKVRADDMIVFPTAERIALEAGTILALGVADFKPRDAACRATRQTPTPVKGQRCGSKIQAAGHEGLGRVGNLAALWVWLEASDALQTTSRD